MEKKIPTFIYQYFLTLNRKLDIPVVQKGTQQRHTCELENPTSFQEEGLWHNTDKRRPNDVYKKVFFQKELHG